MWRRTYLLLLVVRLWFALSPSYLHPDENFQGPEVIAGKQHHSHPWWSVAQAQEAQPFSGTYFEPNKTFRIRVYMARSDHQCFI